MPKSTRDPKLDEDRVALFVAGYPVTVKDLGEELMNTDIREAFQIMIDRGIVPGVPAGTKWHEVIRMDKLETWDTGKKDTKLIAALRRDRDAAAKELIETYTPEAREKVAECQRRIVMAEKLISE